MCLVSRLNKILYSGQNIRLSPLQWASVGFRSCLHGDTVTSVHKAGCRVDRFSSPPFPPIMRIKLLDGGSTSITVLY